MVDKTRKVAVKRLAKGWRIHLRRLKQASLIPIGQAPARPVSDDAKK